MTKELKQSFYEEQIPALLQQMTRIADALERQLELMEERRNLELESQEAKAAVLEGRREERRKKFEAQLHKLAEVDRMARELRRKLEEKQAAEAAAKAPAGEEAAESDDTEEAAEKPSPPPEN